jgi:hypothetical protein
MEVSQMTDTERKIYNQGKRDERKRVYKLIANKTYGVKGTNKCETKNTGNESFGVEYHITLACTKSTRGFGNIMCLCELQRLLGITKRKRNK